MKAYWSIVRRDLKGYFLSPVVYAMATVFLLLTGLLFFSNLIVYTEISFSISENPYISQSLNLTSDFLQPLIAQFAVILLFFIPAITMRTFSEEKRSGTLELLLTYPVTNHQAILGKFTASLLTMGSILLLTIIYPAILFLWSSPELAPILSIYLGLLGMISLFTAIGVFASSMTENQIIAVLIAFGLNLVFWMIGWTSPVNNGLLHDTLQYLSIIDHFEPMIKGIIKLSDITYFITTTIFFLFLTGQVLNSSKWRG
ncbi:ABC transporter permease subunit [bacterium]|nr:ABC transporter permease subunit [bacterium]